MLLNENRKVIIDFQKRLDIAIIDNERNFKIFETLVGDHFESMKQSISNRGRNIVGYKNTFQIYINKLIEFGKQIFYTVLNEAKLTQSKVDTTSATNTAIGGSGNENTQKVMPSQDPVNNPYGVRTS